jgi:hypothetical protein
LQKVPEEQIQEVRKSFDREFKSSEEFISTSGALKSVVARLTEASDEGSNAQI